MYFVMVSAIVFCFLLSLCGCVSYLYVEYGLPNLLRESEEESPIEFP